MRNRNAARVAVALFLVLMMTFFAYHRTYVLAEDHQKAMYAATTSVSPAKERLEMRRIAQTQSLKAECAKLYKNTLALADKRKGFDKQTQRITANFRKSVDATSVAELYQVKSEMTSDYDHVHKVVQEIKEREARRLRTIDALDKYLAGSPLAGHGVDFYDAAKKHGIDPRLAAAISCIESGKGRHCFRSHNAWGWGGSGWDSWTSAIWHVTAGISRVYGYRSPVSMSAKYCTTNPNWGHQVQAEMNKIY